MYCVNGCQKKTRLIELATEAFLCALTILYVDAMCTSTVFWLCFVVVMLLITHWSLGDVTMIKKYCFQTHYSEQQLRDSMWNYSWMPQNLTNQKSTLIQVMAWCRQATSHYLNQCWPSSMSPCGITRPQWVNVVYLPIFVRVTSLPMGQSFSLSQCIGT